MPNGAKLVTKEEKQNLDEWYVHNALLGLRIAMMTIKEVVYPLRKFWLTQNRCKGRMSAYA